MAYHLINPSELKKRFRGDEDILLELIDLFLENSQNLIDDISKAISVENGNNLKLHAHTMKGILKNLAAESASKTSYELELLGLKKKFKEAQGLCEKLVNEVGIICDDLKQLRVDLKVS